MSPLRISSAEHANATRYFPCVDHASIPPFVDEVTPVLQPHRKTSRLPAYGSLPCSPPAHGSPCFRGVYDGLLGEDFADEADEAIYRRGDGDVLDRIALLLENLVLHPDSGVASSSPALLDSQIRNGTRPLMLEPSVRRKRSYAISKDAGNYAELHADYLESPGYVYSAILYDDPPRDLVGGETALVDFVYSESQEAPGGGGGGSRASARRVAFGLKVKEAGTNFDERSQEGDSASRPSPLVNRVKLPPLELASGMVVEPKRGSSVCKLQVRAEETQ